MIINSGDINIETIACDKCGIIFQSSGRGEHISGPEDFGCYQLELKRELCRGLHSHYRRYFDCDLCDDCAKQLIPWFFRLKDIAYLMWEVAKLKGAINERKKSAKNNRTDAPASR